jgi:modulator of drug activity B
VKKILIINAHQYYPYSEGKLTKSLIEIIEKQLASKGYEIKHSVVMNEYDADEEVEKHIWADVVILQSPVYWMGLPWKAKKYIDEVYSEGMEGKLCAGDGRTSTASKKNYGSGGLLKGRKYMLSLTFNAPKEAFSNPQEYLFQGKSVDDLWFAQHMNFRFFAMEPIETFVCYDVMKNSVIENDFSRLTVHLDKNF